MIPDFLAPIIEPDKVVEITIYDPVTGAILTQYTGMKSFLAQNIPDGMDYVTGHAAPSKHRIDKDTKTIVDLTQAEIDDYVGKEKSLRDKHLALTRIKELEDQQNRTIRENTIGRGNSQDLKSRLEAIDDEIIQLRAVINS